MNVRAIKFSALSVLVSLVLTACGGGGGTGGDVSGSVTSNQALAGSYILACFIPSGTQCDLGHQNSGGGTFPTGTGTTSTYTLQKLAAGSYYIIGFFDNNNNKSIDTNEPQTCFSTNGTNCAPVAPPKTGINLSYVAGGSVQAFVAGSGAVLK
jgi:hypothetical protein